MMKKRLILLSVILAVCGCIYFLCTHTGINFSNSVHFHIYFHKPVTEIKKDRYYILNYDGENYSGYITKRVACLTGEKIYRRENTFYCGVNEIGRIVLTENLNGMKYPQYYPPESGEILTNGIFVVGDSLNSYDSRYFGLVPVENFKKEVFPIW